MTELQERASFLARHEFFGALSRDELERIAASIVVRNAVAGEAVQVGGGAPGNDMFVVRDGSFDLLYKDVAVDILGSGWTFGHPSLLTGLSPEFTVRAREDSLLYCIPKDVVLDMLSRPDGVRFVARQLHDDLLKVALTMRSLPDIRSRPVTSLIRRAPVFCEPDTTVRDAAKLMRDENLSALLVRTRDGLGMVTDVDLRDRVVADAVSRDAPVSAVMTTPVKTVSAAATAPEASIEMMALGVNHLPVVDATGKVLGLLSASSLMSLDSHSPFALRRMILGAHTVDDVVDTAGDVPKLFVELLDAHLDAPALTRILTVFSDAMTTRLIDLGVERYGPPPVDFAWLALGSAARSEVNPLSDQDNGLAYADTDDPSVDEYFRLLAEFVNQGLMRCGYGYDAHGVLASTSDWRMSMSEWCNVFRRCLEGRELERLSRASIAFDFRQVAGDLAVVPPLTEIIREAPSHAMFLKGLATLGSEIPSPLGFRHRLIGPIDIKKSGLLPIQNLARYYAFSRGITAPGTLDRLVAAKEARGSDPKSSEITLRDAFTSMVRLQLRHHANAIRAGRPLDNVIDTDDLRPLTKVGLQGALRLVAEEQKRFPRVSMLRSPMSSWFTIED